MKSGVLAVKALSPIPFDNLRGYRDGSQRLLQVVAGGVGKDLQILVGAPQFFVRPLEFGLRPLGRSNRRALSMAIAAWAAMPVRIAWWASREFRGLGVAEEKAAQYFSRPRDHRRREIAADGQARIRYSSDAELPP